jgi:hypothetical protein
MIRDILIVVEVDENQHRGYDKKDEELRITQILHNIGVDKKMVFLRFNPSEYKVNGIQKRTPFENRLLVLKDEVQSVFDKLEREEEYENIHTEIKLFYDEI